LATASFFYKTVTRASSLECKTLTTQNNYSLLCNEKLCKYLTEFYIRTKTVGFGDAKHQFDGL